MRVGLRVKIRQETRYYNQAPNIEGVVASWRGDGWWRVEFSNGYYNAYQIDDLVVIDNQAPIEYKCSCQASDILEIESEDLHGECKNCGSLITKNGEILHNGT